MVKGHHRQYSSSDDSDDEVGHKNRRREKHKRRSKSPEEDYRRGKHNKNRHRSRSASPDEYPTRMRIKPDPDGRDSHHRIKQEQDYGRAQSHRDNRHRDKESRNRPVHIKQEPRDDSYHQRQERRRNDERRRENHQNRQHQRGANSDAFGSSVNEEQETAADTQPKEGPNFELSGKLTEDTNTYKGVVIKYNEPPEARKPKKRWRLYPFKNDESLKPFHMHRQSAYLFGRDRIIADIPVDHPSCSKQHAVFQYRLVPYEKEDGRKAHKIAPYIIDLDSANGTYINNKKMEPQRYYELFEKDVIKFGYSSRDYVLLHDKSDTAEVEEQSD